MTLSPGLTQMFYDGASINPQATAIDSDSGRMSFSELVNRVESIARDLGRRFPEPHTRIGLCAMNHAEHVCAYLGILLSGNVWVPFNPANGRALNSVLAAKASPAAVLVDEKAADHAASAAPALQLDELGTLAGEFVATTPSPDHIAAIKFTGGTSGEPKGVLQTHGNMLAVVHNLQAFYGFSERDCKLAVAPLTHGSSHFVLPILAAGGRLRFVSDTSPGTVTDALASGTTIAFMPPTLIYKLLRQGGPSPGQFTKLRHLTYSAAPMPVARIVEAQEAFGPCLSTLYGQTEAPMTITALGTDEMLDPNLRSTAGKACGSTELRITGDNGECLLPGQVGNVEARGPIVMPGYLDDEVLTSERLKDGWLQTGDVGFMDDAGYLTLTGRSGDLIITGGFNVYPAEIESVLVEAPGVAECCVFGTEDPYWGERIDAVVTVRDRLSPTPDDLIGYVKERLGPVRTPKTIYIARSIPRNAVGKVVRRDMPAFVTTLEEEAG